jgi:hypothetical protein
MFQNVLMDLKVSKNKQMSLFFSMFFGIFVSFYLFIYCVFPISYTCLHVISDKCKYVLFHLNMLTLFQDINIFFLFWEIKLVSNKNFSLKYLIQGFNPHLLS